MNSVDLLTDLLHQAGMRRRLLGQRTVRPGVALRFPCEKSIGLHVVTQGEVHVHAPGLEAPLTLRAGDLALMARGCEHRLSLGPSVEGLTVETIGTDDAATPPEPGAATVVGGAYQLWNDPLHPFFREMPAWFVLRADELPKLGPLALTVGLLIDELRQRQLGAETALNGLMDVVFTYLLREMLARHAPAAHGWALAVRDPQVRRALALMQGEPARAWTLESLALEAGLSRTALAERFRAAMGDTPLSHLRTLRLQAAMRLLGNTDQTLEQVARAVGYQDAFSFSKAFKREVGLSPREFRRQDADERALAYRF
ncbi:AraC family transcriptional regulator [Inhella proteolytica]|uniref:AraC family transcriptional regulator n=1 Tax=Inhella proteolytica TaxID=2795029 RepID=A0A931J720_9BURK|nr:AraC family transcriptional regulator [Inhella proteolytica]MBH9579431.1 AraC family transcriptional regulator [Inhella proteolytica]